MCNYWLSTICARRYMCECRLHVVVVETTLKHLLKWAILLRAHFYGGQNLDKKIYILS